MVSLRARRAPDDAEEHILDEAVYTFSTSDFRPRIDWEFPPEGYTFKRNSQRVLRFQARDAGDPERCRGLLERATHLELNPKAMKFLFKRYLDFERRVGDKKRVEHVKERAMEYVANKFG